MATAIRVIQENEPARAGTIDRTLRGGMECILLKSIEKDRARRYQSVSELATDIRAWLEGEPVSAKPPGAWMKINRAIRRNPLIATTAAALSIATVIVGSSFVTRLSLDRTPARIDRSQMPQAASILSYSGAILRKYGGIGNDVSSFELFEVGGIQFLLVAVHDGLNHTNGQLQLVTLGNSGEPIWATDPTTLTPPPLPARLAASSPALDGFVVSQAIVADVFPDSSEPEIVVSFLSDNSSSAIRVYSLSNKVLYEAWHFGPIRDVQWFESSRIIVATGDRHGDDIAACGWPDAGGTIYPTVVFAVSPDGGASSEWLNLLDASTHPEIVPWYKVLLPRTIIDTASIRLSHNNNSLKTTDGALCEVAVQPRGHASVGVVIDSKGEFLGTRWSDSHFDSNGNCILVSPFLTDWPPAPELVDFPIQD